MYKCEYAILLWYGHLFLKLIKLISCTSCHCWSIQSFHAVLKITVKLWMHILLEHEVFVVMNSHIFRCDLPKWILLSLFGFLQEFESWLQKLPESDQAEAKGFFSVIRRGPSSKLGDLNVVQFKEAYRQKLEEVARNLLEAAKAAETSRYFLH